MGEIPLLDPRTLESIRGVKYVSTTSELETLKATEYYKDAYTLTSFDVYANADRIESDAKWDIFTSVLPMIAVILFALFIGVILFHICSRIIWKYRNSYEKIDRHTKILCRISQGVIGLFFACFVVVVVTLGSPAIMVAQAEIESINGWLGDNYSADEIKQQRAIVKECGDNFIFNSGVEYRMEYTPVYQQNSTYESSNDYDYDEPSEEPKEGYGEVAVSSDDYDEMIANYLKMYEYDSTESLLSDFGCESMYEYFDAYGPDPNRILYSWGYNSIEEFCTSLGLIYNPNMYPEFFEWIDTADIVRFLDTYEYGYYYYLKDFLLEQYGWASMTEYLLDDPDAITNFISD